MSGTNVPPLTIGPTGAVLPAESAIFSGVIADLNAAFGANFNPAVSTPQGQLSSSLTAIIGDVNALLAYLVSQTDPAYATGRMQDAIGRIYFMTRIPASSSVVTCTVTGTAGAVIPLGAIAQDTSGNLYGIQTAIIFAPGALSQSASFVGLATGPISCAANTLTVIYQTVAGWLTVTNPGAAVLGRAVETRFEFEQRRQSSVALNSVGTVAAIQAAVLASAGVLDAYTVQNNTVSPQTIGGVSVPANSIYVSVSGGTGAAIGAAVYSKMPPGIPSAGTTPIVVTDSQSGLSIPYPTYTVNYTPATATPIFFAITIVNSAAVPANAAVLVQAAVINAFGGGDGGQPARLGATLYASRFYPVIAALGTWAVISSLFIGTSASPVTTSVSLTIIQAPTVSALNIAVTA